MIEVRTEKKANPYVMIDNRPLNDRELSYGARGLLSYLLSKPDDWVIKMHDLVGGPDGAHKVRGYLKELQKAGYAYLKKNRDKKGRILGSEWIIREEPRLQKPGSRKNRTRKTRKSEKPHAENPESGKLLSIQRTDPIQRTELQKTDFKQKTESEDAPNFFDPIEEIRNKILDAPTQTKDLWKTRFSADPESLVVDAANFAAWWVSKQDGRSDKSLQQQIKNTGAKVFQMSFQSSWLSNKKRYNKPTCNTSSSHEINKQKYRERMKG